MSHTKQQLSDIYDSLYAKANEILAQHNPCRVKDGVCKRGHFCCEGCKYLSEKGCTVEALTCKTWLCESVRNKACREALNIIVNEAMKYGLYVFRGSKEDSLRNALHRFSERKWHGRVVRCLSI